MYILGIRLLQIIVYWNHNPISGGSSPLRTRTVKMFTTIEIFYTILPIFIFGFSVFCFLIACLCKYREMLVVSSGVMRLSESSNCGDTAMLLVLLLSKVRSIRMSCSRISINLSVICQSLVSLLVAVCWYSLGSIDGSIHLGPYLYFEFMPVSYVIADHFSFSMLALTSFIFLVSFALLYQEVYRNLPVWCGVLFILEGFLFIAFTTSNLLVFYIGFEATLLPMYLLIGAWGSRSRKVKANFYFFLYTSVSSLVTLLGLLLLYHCTGTFSYYSLLQMAGHLDIRCNFTSYNMEYLVWILLSIGFLVKLPIFIFHLWLPEAHVEAHTVGSVILAAVLLKLGLYGFIRVVVGLLPVGTIFWSGFLIPVAVVGTLYPAAVAVVQDDLKRIVAYSSISHMSLALLGALTMTVEGVSGAMFLGVGHGITSGGLFAFVGFLYSRYRTRDLKYVGGMVNYMPYGGVFLIILTLGNVGFPFLCNFPGELLIIVGCAKRLGALVALLGFGFFLTAVYSFRLLNTVMFGSTKVTYIENRYDLTRSEGTVMLLFSVATILFGVLCYPLIGSFVGVSSLILHTVS